MSGETKPPTEGDVARVMWERLEALAMADTWPAGSLKGQAYADVCAGAVGYLRSIGKIAKARGMSFGEVIGYLDSGDDLPPRRS